MYRQSTGVIHRLWVEMRDRAHVARRLPRQRLLPWLVWRYLRWRWPYRRAATELYEHADGSVTMERRPMRVWWPWTWVLATERWLGGPVALGMALWGMAHVVRPWPGATLAAIAGAARSWWVCVDHRSKVWHWSVRTLWPALGATVAAGAWMAWSRQPRWLLAGVATAVMVRAWHYASGRLSATRGIVRTWAVHLGADDRRLAGSVVEDVKRGAGGAVTLCVVLPPGQYSLADLRRSRGHIATAYGTTSAQVRVETGDDDSRPLVHISPPGVLHRTHPWPGDPVTPDGRLVAGVLDDEQPAGVRLWSEVGAKVIWLVGKRGSGKSRAVHLLLAAAARSGLVALDLIDMKGGVDLSRWASVTVMGHIACDLTGARGALRRAERVHDARMAHLRATGREKWVVGQDGPLWLLVIEEAHEALADPECAAITGRLARLSRATGVGAILVTQIAKIEALGGRDVAQNIDLRIILECDRDTATRATEGRTPIDMSAMPPGRPGVALWLGEGCDAGQLGRWYDIDPATVTEGAIIPPLDAPTAEAVCRYVVSCEPGAPQATEAPSREMSPREAVAAFVATHPGATSGEVSKATGVPAGTIRYWKNRGDL